MNIDLFLGHLHSANFAGPLIMHGFAETDAEASVAFIRTKLSQLSLGIEQKLGARCPAAHHTHPKIPL